MAEIVIQYASAGHVRAKSHGRPKMAIWWAGQITSVIIAAGILLGIGWLIAQSCSQVLGILSPLWSVLALVSIAMLMRGLRRSWDATTLEYLEQAVRLNLPLPGMLRAAESSEGRFVRKRLGRLRGQIEDGATLADSLSRTLPGLSARVHGLIVSAEQSGRLASALRRIVVRDRHRLQRDPAWRIYLRWYPMMLLLALGAVVTGVGAYGMPKILYLWKDFHIRVPWLAYWNVISDAAKYALPLAGACAVVFSAQMLVTLFHPRYAGAGPLRRWTDWAAWHLPLLRTVIRGKALGDVCDLVAGDVEAGIDLHRTLVDASEVPTNAVLQRRLRRWAAGIEAGQRIDEAARAARMPAIVSGLLVSADATPDLPNVFRFLLRYYDAQFSRGALLLEGAIIPVIAIVFGVATLFVMLSVFLPLIEIMKHLMPKGTSW